MVKQFKKGQRVKIVKNLYRCDGCGQHHDKYFYKNGLEQVPLNTNAKIELIEERDKLVLKLDDGRRFYFHPDELKLIGGGAGVDDEFAQRVKRVLRHPVFEISENAPVFVINGEVYSVSDGKLNGSSFTEKDTSLVGRLLGGYSVTRVVERIGTLDSLDELLDQRAAEQINILEKGYAEEERLNLRKEEVDGNLDMAQLIYKQVFPYLRTDGYEVKVANVLGVEKAQEKQEQRKKVERTARLEKLAKQLYLQVEDKIEEIEQEGDDEEGDVKIKKKKKRDEKEKELDRFLYDEIDKSVLDDLLSDPKPQLEPSPFYSGNSLLGKAVGLRDFAVSNGILYSLARSDGDSELTIDGNNYVFLPIKEALDVKPERKQEKLEFKVGDKIRMNAGANRYIVTKEGSEGEIIGIDVDDQLYVNFTKVTGEAVKEGKNDMYVNRKYAENLSLGRVEERVRERVKAPGEAEDEYYHELSKRIRINALKKHLSFEDLVDILQGQDAELEEVRGKREYSEGEFGFLRHEGNYYVYLTVPEFALKSFANPGKYYYHGKIRIGQLVSAGSGKIYHVNQPLAIDSNEHLFLHDITGSFIPICFGNHSIPSSGKSSGELIAKRLRSTRDMMLYGYREISGWNNFISHPMSKEQVERKGIMITNPHGY